MQRRVSRWETLTHNMAKEERWEEPGQSSQKMLDTGREWGKQLIIHRGKLRLREGQAPAKCFRAIRS